MKKIMFLTGTRADFGKIKALIRAVEKHSDFEAYIFATGMHLLKLYGYTYTEIEKENFKNIFTSFNQMSSTSNYMDMVLADTIRNLGHYVREFCPDLIVVHGDRVEALAGAIVASLNNIRLAHIEGGELSGTIDEHIRHAVTKLSHFHFTVNDQSAKRLVQLGENENNIFIIGAPDLDIMFSNELPSLEMTRARYDITFPEYAILMYHPVIFELDGIENNINTIVDAAIKSELNYIVVYPNNDIGSEHIRKAYNKLNGNDKFRVFSSLRFEYFLTILKNSKFIIGNSSSGIHEAPAYGIPTINIGTRQRNRLVHDSIFNVKEDKDEILKAINSVPKRFKKSLIFGEGNSAKLFIKALSSKEFWNKTLQKEFVDFKKD